MTEKSPERIWAAPGMPGYITDGPEEGVYDVEYIRADLSDALVAAAYVAAEHAVEGSRIVDGPVGPLDQQYEEGLSEAQAAIRALTPADAQAALDARDERIRREERERCAEVAYRLLAQRHHTISLADATHAVIMEGQGNE